MLHRLQSENQTEKLTVKHSTKMILSKWCSEQEGQQIGTYYY